MKEKILLASLLILGGTSRAGVFTPLDLPTLTDDIRSNPAYADGAAFNPLFPTNSKTFAGVPFHFQAAPDGSTIFLGGTVGAPEDTALHMPVNIFGVTSVYTLINTICGVAGVKVGSVTFKGSGGASYTVDLIEGSNVRDYYYGGFVNTTTDSSVTEAVFGVNSPGHAHLDMQAFALPPAFANETLEEIVFFTQSGNGAAVPNGKAFIAAATVMGNGAVVPVNYAVVFYDDFNAENGGVGVYNYTGFANWTVSNGTVDLIGNGLNDVFPGNGLYVDLDGTSFNAGTMTSKPIALAPGNYVLSFDLAAAPDVGNVDIVHARVDVGIISAVYTVNYWDLRVRKTLAFALDAPTTVNIVFHNEGGDDIGAELDNVELARITGSTPVDHAVVFYDDFNAENGGVGAYNYTGFANWTVSNGTVDLVGNGFDDEYPGNGLYVDLDGTTFEAGTMTSKPISLVPGEYMLSFYLAGAPDVDVVHAGVQPGIVSAVYTVGYWAPRTLETLTFTVETTTTVNIVFHNEGGDNIRAKLDDVELDRITGSTPVFGDLNNDGCVDRGDLAILMTKIQARSRDLTYDLNGDGKVDVADARFLVLHFTNPDGSSCLSR